VLLICSFFPLVSYGRSPGYRLAIGALDKFGPAVFLLKLDICNDRLQIITKLLGVLSANGANLFHNRIFGHIYTSINSIGEQITGGS
jgi:hypothetical protein